MKAESGFAVTQVGRFERLDGARIAPEDTSNLMEGLNWYLSFVCGYWTGPCLARGFDRQGRPAWEVWHHTRVAPYRDRTSWLCRTAKDQLSHSFAGFVSAWADPFWRDVITSAIHWYVEANACAGSIEGSIVLTQTAFELLSSAVLVEKHAWLSSDRYEKLTAADRVRLLFRWAGIPTDIPAAMAELTSLAKAENCTDAPAVMTLVRNTITHPTRKNRERYDKHTDGGRQQVWWLGLWGLELCLLRLLDYQGVYGNRLTRTKEWEVEVVPWAAGG